MRNMRKRLLRQLLVMALIPFLPACNGLSGYKEPSFSEIENGLFVYVNILPFVRSIVNIHLPGKAMRSGKRWPFAARNVADDEAVCGLLRCKRLPLRP